MRCCVCGGDDTVRHCSWCGHNFCIDCRWGVPTTAEELAGKVKGLYWRGKAGVKQWLYNNKPAHCNGH